MTIDFEYIRWLVEQTDEVVQNVVPLVARILGVDADKLAEFIVWLRQAADAVIDAVEIFIKFPAAFGAPGEGLTDANGVGCPDCPAPAEFAPVVFALKSEVA